MPPKRKAPQATEPTSPPAASKSVPGRKRTIKPTSKVVDATAGPGRKPPTCKTCGPGVDGQPQPKKSCPCSAAGRASAAASAALPAAGSIDGSARISPTPEGRGASNQTGMDVDDDAQGSSAVELEEGTSMPPLSLFDPHQASPIITPPQPTNLSSPPHPTPPTISPPVSLASHETPDSADIDAEAPAAAGRQLVLDPALALLGTRGGTPAVPAAAVEQMARMMERQEENDGEAGVGARWGAGGGGDESDDGSGSEKDKGGKKMTEDEVKSNNLKRKERQQKGVTTWLDQKTVDRALRSSKYQSLLANRKDMSPKTLKKAVAARNRIEREGFWRVSESFFNKAMRSDTAGILLLAKLDPNRVAERPDIVLTTPNFRGDGNQHLQTLASDIKRAFISGVSKHRDALLADNLALNAETKTLQREKNATKKKLDEKTTQLAGVNEKIAKVKQQMGSLGAEALASLAELGIDLSDL